MSEPDHYTVTRQGNVWVASDGTNHVEAENPEEALSLLTLGQMDEEYFGEPVEESVAGIRADDLVQKIGDGLVRMVRLMALGAPAEIVRNEVRLMADWMEQWLNWRESKG